MQEAPPASRDGSIRWTQPTNQGRAPLWAMSNCRAPGRVRRAAERDRAPCPRARAKKARGIAVRRSGQAGSAQTGQKL